MLRMVLLSILLLGFGSNLSSGTWQEVLDYPKSDCIRIPEETLCLSACAFGASKSGYIIKPNSSTLGYHFPYNSKTLETDLTLQIQTLLFLHENPNGPSVSNLFETTPSYFYAWPNDYYFNWRDIRQDYKLVTSSTSDLLDCTLKGKEEEE